MEKKTPLYAKHNSLGAKFIPFAGFSMPVWYKGIKEEHKAVRERVGVFDINHMGELLITGKDRYELVNHVITNDLEKIDYNQVLYTFICGKDGIILDDLLVYLFADKISFVVNVGQSEKLVKHIKKNGLNYDFEIKDISEKTGALSVQGPRSFDLCKKVFGVDLEKVTYYSFITSQFQKSEVLLSRTGYTGEKGFELFFDNDINEALWDALLIEGKEYSVEPCGLGARDILRLEMGYPLSGQELQGHTPIELQKNWCVSFKKDDFIGKSVLQSQKENGCSTTLSSFVLLEKGVPRQHYEILKNQENIGFITSGGYSLLLEKGIGLCLIDKNQARIDNQIDIVIRGQKVPAKITKIPFVQSRAK